MTTTDKTKDKLVDSMRKSKASGGNKTTAKRSTAKSSDNASLESMTEARKQENKASDSFQSNRRVWPD